MRRLALLTALATAAAACSKAPPPTDRTVGQTRFLSAPPAGGIGSRAMGGPDSKNSAAPGVSLDASTAATPRAVEETDLYRLEGDRLYFLNGYRGLMVFDVSNVDQPKLIGRSPIYGWPVDMIVRNGIAIVVVADWYGQLEDGSPFHGSIVRGLDATDPANIKVLGEARLGGWVRDDRVVGNVLYAVSEDYGWAYGWDAAVGIASTKPTVIVSSVSFDNNVIQAVGNQRFEGYSGIFNVTANSILLAHDSGTAAASTELLYLDISDPQGAIAQRGRISVDGRVQGWGADNGRWNLDFADGKTAHLVGCASGQYGCDGTGGYLLSSVDFSNPDAPALRSALTIPSTGWLISARFDANRLYLSPSTYVGTSTPFQVYDLSDPAHPELAGSATIPGTVWLMVPAPQQRLFALGNEDSQGSYGQAVSLKYLDVSNPSRPELLGSSIFGEGWAWTPAAGTFKAFTMDASQGLVVLPFSGWSSKTGAYLNGLQLIEFTPTSVTTAGTATTRGWVERGIFVHGRLVSLSDMALSVIDYSNRDAPKVTAALTLARNVIAAQPSGATIAEISSDWWDNDVSVSEVRVLPLANAEESTDAGDIPSALVDGINAQVFRNGDLAYVVTSVRVSADCPSTDRSVLPQGPCYARAQQVQVVDLSGGGAKLRGKVRLPVDPWGYYGWGWWGCFWYDWFDGASVVQVGKDALAVRRWQPLYGPGGYTIDGNSALFVIDLSDADAPSIASTTITDDPAGWWGNMRVVGSTLYTTHYEWFERNGAANEWTVRYYANRIDLSDRRHPRVEAKINMPGLIIGGSATDPSLLYAIDYRWMNGEAHNDFDVVRVRGDVAELLSQTAIDGWVGETFVRGSKAYFSVQQYNSTAGTYSPKVALHALDLSNPSAPVDHVSSGQKGWGWLLAVEGDRAVVSSGWGYSGVDIYTLADGQAPRFSQFARTRGWWSNAATRQDNALFLSSGYWGVQRINLQ